MSNFKQSGAGFDWRHLAAMLLALTGAVATSAQTWDSQHFAQTGQSVVLDVFVNDPAIDRVLFEQGPTPDGSDSFGGPSIVPLDGGVASQTLNLGGVPGARQILFCLLVVGDNTCSANLAIWVGAVDASCTLQVAPVAGDAPLPVTVGAECLLQLGTGIGLVGADYQWTLPPGVQAPPGGPPLPVQTGFELTVPGTYTVSILPRFELFMPSADAPPDLLVLGPFAENIDVSGSLLPPQVSLTAPQDGAQFVAPANFQIVAQAVTATPGTVINQVEFLIDGQPFAVATSPPFQTQWPTAFGPGVYLLGARATDSEGQSGLADPIQIVILEPDVENQPPEVRITAPSSGSVFTEPAAFDIEVAASDPDGEIVLVEFLIDGTVIGERTSPPYLWPAPAGLAVGSHLLSARATDDAGASTTSEPVEIHVVREADRVILLSPPGQLDVRPGHAMTLLVQAANAFGPVPDTDLQWRVEGGQGAELLPDLDCAADDTPAGGLVRTGADGEASIAFVAGCASGARSFEVWLARQPAVRLSVPLPGPDQAVDRLAPRIDGEAIVARIGEATPVPVLLTTAVGAPVVSARVNFTLEPASAGTLLPSAVSGQQGIATSSLVLNDGVVEALIRACIAGRDEICATLPVRSLELAVLKPASELLAPIVRSAIEAPRVQMEHVRTRLRVLRNHGGHGFSNDIRIAIDQLGTPLPGSVGENATKAEVSPLGFFAGGDISVGKRPGRDGGYRASTRGLTVGTDYRFTPALVAGAALGGLRTDTDLANGGDQEARGVSLSLFGQWLPSEHAYVAGIVHAGRNRYDIERPLPGRESLLSDTDSRQEAAQFETGYSFSKGPMRFTPFARYEYIRARIDGIRERGGLDALEISELSLRARTLSGGLFADYAISHRSGVWIPGLRVEYFHESLDQDEVLARLIAGNIGASVLQLDRGDRRYGTAGLSLQWLTALGSQPLSMLLGFDTSFARDDYDSRRFTFSLKIPL